jgi:predicted porin
VTADFQGDLTERLGFELGYGNTIYDYEQGGVGGYSSILDRMEHLAHLDLRWRIRPELIGVFGYQFGYNDYSGDSAMYFDAFGNKVTSDVRDSYNHYIDHSFTAKLKGSIRLGAQYVDYTDALPGTDNKWTPYADSSLTYTYMPDSYLQVGVKVTRLATDIVSPDSSGPTEDQEARTIYAMVNHKFTSRFTANIIGQYQNAEFSEGAFDNDKDKLYLIGVNLDYALTKYFGLEAGYNYDKLDSDVPNRSYNRNRFYFGIRATY